MNFITNFGHHNIRSVLTVQTVNSIKFRLKFNCLHLFPVKYKKILLNSKVLFVFNYIFIKDLLDVNVWLASNKTMYIKIVVIVIF